MKALSGQEKGDGHLGSHHLADAGFSRWKISTGFLIIWDSYSNRDKHRHLSCHVMAAPAVREAPLFFHYLVKSKVFTWTMACLQQCHDLTCNLELWL